MARTVLFRALHIFSPHLKILLRSDEGLISPSFVLTQQSQRLDGSEAPALSLFIFLQFQQVKIS